MRHLILAKWRFATSLVLTWTLATSPLLSIPVLAHAEDASTVTAEPPSTQLLLLDIDALMDRAAYPYIPRRGATGRPTESEITAIQGRLAAVRNKVQTQILDKMPSANDEQELSALNEIYFLFECVRKFEGIKILLGQAPNQSEWTKNYVLTLPLKGLAQAKFLMQASFFSEHFVPLKTPKITQDLIAAALSLSGAFFTRVENDTLTFNLDPKFVSSFERLRLISSPSLKTGLQFAMLFAAERLYDSQALTHLLRGQDPMTLPAPRNELTQRWLTLRFAQAANIRAFKTKIAQNQKTEILKQIIDAVQVVNAKKQGYSIDQEFITRIMTLAKIREVYPTVKSEVETNESDSFNMALVAQLNLIEPSDRSTFAQSLIYESKRLSLRWLILTKESVRAALTPQTRSEIEALIDNKAKIFTEEILKSSAIQSQIAAIASSDAAAHFKKTRIEFASNMRKSSSLIDQAEQAPVDFKYLLKSKAGELKALSAGPYTISVLEDLTKVTDYADGYNQYRTRTLEYLRGFHFAKPLIGKITISRLNNALSEIKWNSSQDVPNKYAQAFGSDGAREKDLQSLLALGRILKFDIYELLNGQSPTMTNLGFDSSWTGKIFSSESKAYLAALRNDVADNSPILASPTASGQPLWQVLAKAESSPEALLALLDPQLAKTQENIQKTENLLIQHTQEVDAIQNDQAESLTQPVRTLVTRSAQISMALTSFASFGSFYSKMRYDFLAPGFIGREWQQFSDWSNSVNNYLLLYILANSVGSRVAAVGKALTFVNRALAPIFGPNLIRLYNVLWVTLGIGVSSDLYNWRAEAAKISTLQDYADCGSAKPCVSLPSEVEGQTEFANMYRNKAAVTAVITGAAILGLRYILRLGAVLSDSAANLAGKGLWKSLQRDVEILNATSFDQKSLQTGLQNALAKAATIQDPVARELAEAYATQAYYRLQSQIWKDSRTWIQTAEAYVPGFKKSNLNELGLNSRTWTDPQALADALQRVEQRYAQGQLLASQYQMQKAMIFDLYTFLSPRWALASKSDLAASYYARIWFNTGENVAAQAQGSARLYSERLAKTFAQEMDKFYGNAIPRVTITNESLAWTQPARANMSGRMDDIIDNLIEDLRKNPEQAARRLESLSRELHKAGAL